MPTSAKSLCRKTFLAMPLFVVALFTAASCGSSGEGGQTTYAHTISRIIPYIEEQMQKDQVTGMALVLVDGGRTVWARGFGYADLAQQIPATEETLFEIGSNSKTMTAALVMQLAEQGRLHVDDPVVKHLPAFALKNPLGTFPSPGGAITLRHMMTHHSGIPGDLFNGAFTGSSTSRDHNKELVAYLAGEYAAYPTDFLLAYSNTAVSLLADVVAGASGQSFRERSEAFFTALGMDHTTFFRQSATVPARQSKGYILGKAYGPFYCHIPAAGSVLSSASDMAKYLKMVLAEGMGERSRVLAPETLATMLTRANDAVPLDGDFPMGLGWFLGDDDMAYAGRICWHNGGTVLMMSHMEILRDHGLGVVVMTNSITGASVAEGVAKKLLQLALEEKKGIQPPTPPVPDPSPVVTWTDAQLDEVAGVYVTTSGYDRLLRVPGGLRWISGAGHSPDVSSSGAMSEAVSERLLVPRANGWFSSPDSQEEQFEFSEVEGRRIMAAHTATSQRLLGERYEPPASLAEAWRARAGVYEVTNLDGDDVSRHVPEAYRLNSFTMALKVQDGLLVMEFTDGVHQGLQYVIHPVSDTQGYLRGLGRNLGGSVQVLPSAGGEELQLLGMRYRKR